jgi:hypothetical protein
MASHASVTRIGGKNWRRLDQGGVNEVINSAGRHDPTSLRPAHHFAGRLFLIGFAG